MDRSIFFRLQPIEIAKPFFVLFTAEIINKFYKRDTYYSYGLSLIILTIISILLLYQPDIGQTILLIATWISIIFVSGIKISFLIMFSIFLIFISGFLLIILPEKFGYIIQRLKVFYDPTKGDSFQTEKSISSN